jgi:hypothetical protein
MSGEGGNGGGYNAVSIADCTRAQKDCVADPGKKWSGATYCSAQQKLRHHVPRNCPRFQALSPRTELRLRSLPPSRLRALFHCVALARIDL